MSDESFRRIPKADVIRLLSESKAREAILQLELVGVHAEQLTEALHLAEDRGPGHAHL